MGTARSIGDVARLVGRGAGNHRRQREPATWSVSWCGDVLVSLGAKGIAWRDGTTGAVLATAPALTRPSHIACAPDGGRALAYGDGVEVWNTHDRVGQKIGDRWVGSAAWGASDRVVLGFEDAVEIWRLARGKPVREVRRGRRPGACLAGGRPHRRRHRRFSADRPRLDRDRPQRSARVGPGGSRPVAHELPSELVRSLRLERRRVESRRRSARHDRRQSALGDRHPARAPAAKRTEPHPRTPRHL